MIVLINYYRAITRHPDAVEDILKQKLKSTSESKDTPLEMCKWSYDWAIGGLAPMWGDKDFFEDVVTHNLSTDDRVQDLLRRVEVILVCKAGRGMWCSKLDVVPLEIHEQCLLDIEFGSELREKNKGKSAEDYLKELSKDPGFVHFKFTWPSVCNEEKDKR